MNLSLLLFVCFQGIHCYTVMTFYKPIKPGLMWPPMSNVYMLCVWAGVAKSFFTEGSLRITKARRELWVQSPKEQMGYIQSLPKSCILGLFLCVESDSFIKLSWSPKTVWAPHPPPPTSDRRGAMASGSYRTAVSHAGTWLWGPLLLSVRDWVFLPHPSLFIAPGAWEGMRIKTSNLFRI
jgi:hypothetical protein